MLQRDIPQEVVRALRQAQDLVFDVDLTLTERQQPLKDPLAETLRGTGRRIGICTSRAENELDEIFQSPDPELSRRSLISGPVILEDGCVLVRPGAIEPELLVPHQSAAAVKFITEKIVAQLSEETYHGPWRQLAGLPQPFVQVPVQYNYRTSLSIWQHSPAGMETLRSQLEHTMRWCRELVDRAGLGDLVVLSEIGDGTLRISVPGRNKGVALRELHEHGTLDLSRAVYFCDGANDIPAARVMREYGGCVIAVDTHCPRLLEHATFTAPTKGPEAVRRILLSALRDA